MQKKFAVFYGYRPFEDISRRISFQSASEKKERLGGAFGGKDMNAEFFRNSQLQTRYCLV